MKARPILFSAPMILALLAGTKTQTRRPVKPKHAPDALWGEDASTGLHRVFRFDEEAPADSVPWWNLGGINGAEKHCPYGQAGDQLWVREAWSTHACFDSVTPRDLTTRSIHYIADGDVKSGKYRPPMFMPRWASRITLEIVSVRVERLQDISEDDALAEGIVCENVIVSSYYAAGHHEVTADRYFFDGCPDEGFESACEAYAALWEKISGAGSWAANPWVWHIEFKRISL